MKIEGDYDLNGGRMGKVGLITGIIGVMLGGAILLISLLLPQFTRGVSMSEAMIGVVAGILVLLVSFVVAVIGLVLVLMKKKNANP